MAHLTRAGRVPAQARARRGALPATAAAQAAQGIAHQPHVDVGYIAFTSERTPGGIAHQSRIEDEDDVLHAAVDWSAGNRLRGVELSDWGFGVADGGHHPTPPSATVRLQ
ncbi:hypothetical protein SAMN05421505_11840 [Sinosporangium album]|uniref:Uncharacterized protein n=1 Tax=Sinosporangium album TaxID=504805 RepID=A0A1G8DGC0_9ACTN|nr:hypothetical protein [Sinosporangium album]SDH56681.1 hypothetical protein SAMN05421505_11840 [Sinosporangium album]